jgi:hypothetical protein
MRVNVREVKSDIPMSAGKNAVRIPKRKCGMDQRSNALPFCHQSRFGFFSTTTSKLSIARN